MAEILGKLLSVLSLATSTFVQSLPGLLALLLVLTLFLLAGAAICRNRMPVLLLVCGWALSTLLAVLLSVAGISLLYALPLLLLALAAVGLWRLRPGQLDLVGLLPCLVLGAPLVILSASSPATFFDSYLHWLPNAHYMEQLNQLVRQPVPAGFYSMHQTYPAALSVPVYLASKFGGQFAIGAARCLVSVLLVLSAQLIARLMRVSSKDTGYFTSTWGTTLFVLAALALLNPAINNFHFWPPAQSIQFWSPIADPALAALTSIALLTVALRIGGPLSGMARDNELLRGLATSQMAVGVLIAMTKPNGSTIVGVILIASALVVFAGRLGWKAAVRGAPWLLVGAIAGELVWQAHLHHHAPAGDGLYAIGMKPIQDWRFDLLPQLLNAWAKVALDNLAFYALPVIGLVLGLWRLRRRADDAAVINVLAAISGLALLGHVASLVVAFLGVGLEPFAIVSADSAQRYSAQLGVAGCLGAVLAIALRVPRKEAGHWCPRLIAGPRIAMVTLLAYLPISAYAIGNIRFYQVSRQESYELSKQALRSLPPHTRVAVIGERWSTIFARYAGWTAFDPAERPLVIRSLPLERLEELPRDRLVLERWMRDSGIDCVLLLDAVELAVSLDLVQAPDHRWCAHDGAWRTLNLGRRDLYTLSARN